MNLKLALLSNRETKNFGTDLNDVLCGLWIFMKMWRDRDKGLTKSSFQNGLDFISTFKF